MAARLDVINRVARLEKDIAALNERIKAKQAEKQALLNEAQAVLDSLRPQPVPQPRGNGAHSYSGRRRGPAKGTPNTLHRSLTPAQVREIRKLAAQGTPQTFIGKKFGLSQPTVSTIVRRLTYADVK